MFTLCTISFDTLEAKLESQIQEFPLLPDCRSRALRTETEVESETSQNKDGISVDSNNSGIQ